MSETESDPADEPNESAWNEEAVEGQLNEVEDDSGGEGHDDEDEAGEEAAGGD